MSDQDLNIILGAALALIAGCVILFLLYRGLLFIIQQMGPAIIKTIIFLAIVAIGLFYFKPEIFDKYRSASPQPGFLMTNTNQTI